MRRWPLVLLLAFAIGLCAPQVHAKRIALAIGNDNYRNVSKLQKAGNDALAMATELTAAGYEVVLQRDLDYRGMVRSLETLYNSITGGDEVIVFFAGHGVQIKSGSFLLPIDIEATSESEVERTSYALNDLMEHLEQARASFSLVLVDACRDNPLKSKGRSVGTGRGLNPPDPPKGQMVVYSASRGQQALDRLSEKDANPNGVFTREFISRMRRPGLRIEDLVRETQESVERLARSVNHEQRPAIYNETRGSFYFFAPTTAGSAIAVNAASEDAPREDRFWEDTKYAGNRDGFEAYLEVYPKGRYAALARANISRLGAGGTVSGVLSNSSFAAGIGRPVAPALATGAVGATVAADAAAVAAVAPVVAAPAASTALLATAAATTASAAMAAPTTVAPAPFAPSTQAISPPAPVRLLPSPPSARRTSSRITFPNGDTYDGELEDNLIQGKGTQTFASGDVYSGEFQRGVKVGNGAYKYVNGDRYEGEFADNEFHGHGTQTFRSGDVYSGDFRRGVKSGQGMYKFANGDVYEGEFAENLFHGKGKQSFASGDVYEGEFQRGMKHGHGAYRFANGDRFVGALANNQFNGRGTMVYANGDRYEGTFLSDTKTGQGTHFFANGERYEGHFQANAQGGAGTHFYANGERFVGQFASGRRHGTGTYYFVNGETRTVEFANGVEKPK